MIDDYLNKIYFDTTILKRIHGNNTQKNGGIKW